ncbi:hypothetical protein COW36_20490 [bacterium (Candidatus Blackallbacteria) CG17_big_fil_post_rev_8_21_14_2_50_48_46]|uniref:Type II secretion system protein GspE N-terminal domain-containing protein n=1 Tax=bacterium (Candidatus Blackallbacteria) CG17_big_fil_post_rev_8_21_14_2_50_48_46 TaxID=2014261 RepID=A0A2M7FZG3_9BACT|nr:MAG: hypothetical protein COW64_22815 [bacterium (Candidatus Blackallbacteria) CG18_big_fil_WC_8_21_14_2_50_49_26]PIW14784.1 MAG: hypothetical protein COW36_20490 [bacterium (Candidatus Blackallbacteria) CG17_big_fil_post_rev_8_21_14_2_50_48_46]PIW50886.1 MAG: hypothetical protein COW20_01305 [bacterium (Candidatus Blackallbacteria) CG13_big_fil_rev_8_21_14_2_50_49_14]
MHNLSVYTLKPLGEQLLESGLLTQNQLEQALSMQKQNPERLLGQILVESGFLTQAEFETFMQARIGIQQPLGELLIQKNLIQREQLNQALSIQMQTGPAGKPLGQLLVDMGAISKQALDEIIKQQARDQESVRKTMGKQKESLTLERAQVEDIQKLLSAGHLFLALARFLMPDARKLFEERFQVFHQLYHPPELQLSEALQGAVIDFFIHFLPLLEWGMTSELSDEIEEWQHSVMNAGFFAFVEGLCRDLLKDLPMDSSFALSSLVLTEVPDTISFREALYLVMRSPYLLPHGSLMTLRFLLNEFWGQRSILEQRGVHLVRNEDEVDLSDFFRPRISEHDSDLEYVSYMENHLFTQIENLTEKLKNCPPQERESTLIEMMEFNYTLLQTHRDLKVTSLLEAEAES